MKRAAVLIGVKKSGDLPLLPAVSEAIAHMRAWLLSQGLTDDQIKIIVDDERTPVVAGQILDAVKELAAPSDVEQLVIYFCGHGVVNNQSELWLLTDAPESSEAGAVNVDRSENRARNGVFEHVIFISDACRTAAPGLQYQQVGGSSIFPNTGVQRAEERSVDRYFACGLNMPSHQIRAGGSDKFESIYTRTLVSALQGDFHDAVCVGQSDAHAGKRLVHGFRLKKVLKAKVPAAMETAGVSWEDWQMPDARINSDPGMWISDLGPSVPEKPSEAEDEDEDAGPGGAYESYAPSSDGGGYSPTFDDTRYEMPPSFDAFGGWLPDDPALSYTLREDILNPLEQLGSIPVSQLPPADRAIRETAARVVAADSAVPSHFESGKGFVVHGTNPLVQASSPNAQIFVSNGAAVVWSLEPVIDVLLIFADGSGTVLPAIAGFIASLTLEGGTLLSVSYEPMDPSQRTDPHLAQDHWPERWREARELGGQLRETRALIAAMSQAGTFRLDADGPLRRERAGQLARQIQMAKTYDPSMAIYAAYAYYDLQMGERNVEMGGYLARDLGMVFFDLALVTDTFSRRSEVSSEVFYPVFPTMPMLSRGWSLLPDASEQQSSPLIELQRYVRRSLWTLFDPQGVAFLQARPEILEMTDERAGFRTRTRTRA
jgi:hypothetical protein